MVRRIAEVYVELCEGWILLVKSPKKYSTGLTSFGIRKILYVGVGMSYVMFSPGLSMECNHQNFANNNNNNNNIR